MQADFVLVNSRSPRLICAGVSCHSSFFADPASAEPRPGLTKQPIGQEQSNNPPRPDFACPTA
ncbi:MAG: hypothetical protein DME24_03195 [Verrucomicrobia bacterium]|nr:MAG: hypothetical protein DME24_03195 [Verrucomicrobiota bacterium]